MSASTSFRPRRFSLIALDEIRKAVVVDIALAVSGSVEVHPVDDAFQRWVSLGDAVQVRRQALANLAGELADDGPDRVIGVVGLERQVEADELVVLLDELERLRARANLFGDAVQFVIEDVAQPLGED